MVLAWGLGIMAVTTPGPAMAGAWQLFGTQEVRAEDVDAFTKWTGMLQRFGQEPDAADLPLPCGRGQAAPCRADRPRHLDPALAEQPMEQQLRTVNRLMNDALYIFDWDNWGVADYWATPLEFAARDGDCEDYAISKYLALKALGVAAERMRIVVLQDTNLNIAHAVLAVAWDERIWILDNQVREMVPHDRVHHYRPIYSINEQAWWRHIGS